MAATIYIPFPGGSVVRNPPAMQETWALSLGREDTPGEGNVNPLQFSCLGTPTDRGAWWATVHSQKDLETKQQSSVEGFPSLHILSSIYHVDFLNHGQNLHFFKERI